MREILIQKLDKRKVCSVWVPHTVSLKHKHERVLCAETIVKLVDGHCLDDLMKFWVTGDETIFTKQENMAWLGKHEKRPRIVRPKLTPNKVMICLLYTSPSPRD